jgi:hypothetical protein
MSVVVSTETRWQHGELLPVKTAATASDRHGQDARTFKVARHRQRNGTWHATSPVASDRWARVEETITDRWARSYLISIQI